MLINFGVDKKFHKIYAGYGHSMAIAKDINEVYTWGDCSKGQLGRGNDDSFEPGVVDELSGRDIIKGYY
jgi:alpha-tubulin suppressor-like RCC1 family protein